MYRRQLVEEVEGLSLGNHGFVITAYNAQDKDIALGEIAYDTGCVVAFVKYAAICFRPFRNEVCFNCLSFNQQHNISHHLL